jgi:glycosyltransferase involved in cell wall biosynthesis
MRKISLCVFFYQHKSFAESCIRSIGKLRRMPDEIIVSDDASNDGTQRIVIDAVRRSGIEALVVFEFNERNIGLIPQVNKAVQKSSGDIVFLLGGDDEVDPDYVSRCLVEFDDERVMGVGVNPAVIDSLGHPLGCLRSRRGDEKLDWRSWISAEPSYHCAFRRQVFDMFGPLTDGGGEDVQLQLRELVLGDLKVLDIPLVRYRRHDASLSNIAHRSSVTQAEWTGEMARWNLLNLRSLENCISTLNKFEASSLVSKSVTRQMRTMLKSKCLGYAVDYSLLSGKPISLLNRIARVRRDGTVKAAIKGLLGLIAPPIARRLMFAAHARYLDRKYKAMGEGR